MKQAFAYLRVSSVGQTEMSGGTGIERQLDVCREYAKRMGLEIVEVYRDEAVSGTTEAAHRPGLSRLMADAKEKGIKIALCERADRIGRDMLVSEMALQQCRDAGLDVFAAESGTNLTDESSPERVLIRQLLAAVSHFDRAQLVSKMKIGRDKKSATIGRRCEGRIGYERTEAGKAIVGRIAALRRKPKGLPRKSWGEIARTLNEEGIPSPTGTQWMPCVVRRIHDRVKTAA